MLVDADHADAIEPGRVIDQDPLALGQDRAVGGVPGDPQALGDPGHREVLDHDPFQRPPQPTPRQLRPRLSRPTGVLAPHMTAAHAPVAANGDEQHGGSPPERLVREPTRQAVPRHPFAATPPAPLIRLDDPARQHRTIDIDPLAHDLQPEPVQAGERGQIGHSEGSVGHVEVFQMGSVRTSILGGPRPLPGPRRAAPTPPRRYTPNCEE